MFAWRLAIGLVASSLVAFGAKRAAALTTSGALAATLVGVAAVAAGWSWGVLLVVYFTSSVALSRWHSTEKAARTHRVVEKGGARDARQVVANGAVFAVAAAASLMTGMIESRAFVALGAGAIASSASDTWATEIGTAFGGTPRSILTWRSLAIGTSGGVTAAGCLASIAGAAFVASAVVVLGWPPAVATAAFVGGLVGSALDSVFGATAQAVYTCPSCQTATERRVHDCGTVTRRAAGIPWIDNDAVNLLATIGGGLLAMALAR